MQCGVCGGDLTYLGQMGQKMWFRCRQCGMNISDDAANWNVVEDDDTGEVIRLEEL